MTSSLLISFQDSVPVLERRYKLLRDVAGEDVLAEIPLKLMANFTCIEPMQQMIAHHLAPYGINPQSFSVYFDGSTFEYFPKILSVRVFVFRDSYSFDFTKPQWLGSPRSRKTEQLLLGHK